jgi:phosphoribosylaminoimidazole-succinocarboxamide synthase
MAHTSALPKPVSRLDQLPLVHRGKVRQSYAVGDDYLLMVASDRLSAFDVILPDVIPDKGRILTEVSNFWFARSQSLVANHTSDVELSQVISPGDDFDWLQGRAVVVKRLRPLPVEAIVRGYVVGSGWKEYQATGGISGIALPAGLQQAQQLEHAIFTPSTKAAVGDHDENISFGRMSEILGETLAEQIRAVSLDIYRQARDFAAARGIIIADTKMEFGLDADNQLVLMDELLTPDSSRFWPADSYQLGISPPSLDKQFVRDYLETLDWNKTSPGPSLPADIIAKTQAKYQQVRDILLA